MLLCPVCSALFDRRNTRRTYCSTKCQLRAERLRSRRTVTCAWCGAMTERVIRPRSRPTCSGLCRTALAQYDLGNVSRPWNPKVPKVPKTPEVPQRIRFVSALCPRCNTMWLGDRAKGSNQERYCSKTCSNADSKDRRRARKRHAFVAPVYRSQIFLRDNFICHLCLDSVDIAASVPHPLAPTIDHILPLARGGTHEPANVATAHFLCNATKGDRVRAA